MKNFETIYCVEKTTHLERIKNQKLEVKISKRKKENHDNHHYFMDFFLEKLSKNFSNIKKIKDDEMANIQPTKKDLVISCGGDGTFLACAQDYLESTLLGVNTNYLPQDTIFGSLGALTTINKDNFNERWNLFIQGKYQLKKWRRLAAKINGNRIHRYAVNDIFLGRKTSYKTCYCSLEIKEQYSEFFCSGILTCTGVGSHAWFRNAGGTPFDNSLNAFAYLVLNPNSKSQLPCSSEILLGNQSIKIKGLTDAITLCFDSREMEKVKINEEIEIFLDKEKPIEVLDFYSE